MNSPQQSGLNGWFRSRTGVVLMVFLAIAAFYLFTEHTAHTPGVLPYAIVLLCPLLHLFMHGGHGGHGGHSNDHSHTGNDQVE